MKEMNVHYQNQGNYQLPCIATKKQNELHIGVWANRHRQYLKQHHRIRYYNLLTSERLYPYLADIEEQAQTIFTQLVNRNASNMSFESVRVLFAREDTLEQTVRNEVLSWEK